MEDELTKQVEQLRNMSKTYVAIYLLLYMISMMLLIVVFIVPDWRLILLIVVHAGIALKQYVDIKTRLDLQQNILGHYCDDSGD
jgi:ABC-type transport system involved in cytochrome bd biosynthesis fused ATPase/permease subunit